MPGNGRDGFVTPVLAHARAQHDRAGQGGHSPGHVHDRRAGKVHMAMAKAQVGAQLRQPAPAPNPVSIERIEEHGHEQAVGKEGQESPAFGHSAGGNGGCRVHEHGGKQEHRQVDRIVCNRDQRELARANDSVGVVPNVQADLVRGCHGRAQCGPAVHSAQHQTKATQPETQHPKRIDNHVHGHGVHRVLGARESCLHHGESNLHEHDQEGAQQHPGQVERVVEGER